MRTILMASAAALLLSASASAQSRDGRLFDAGINMTEPASGAPDQLAAMQYVIGQWDVDYREFRADTVFQSGAAQSSITFMNRGHAIMERWFCDGCGSDGRDMATLSFLAYNKVSSIWNLGVADGYTESIWVATGSTDGDDLVLHNAVRHIGAAILTYYRITYKPTDEGFATLVETSKDYEATWQTAVVNTYRRRSFDPEFLAPGGEFGSPSPERDQHSEEFDFLIGTYDAAQQLTLPNGQDVSFPSTTTAVYALDGKGILEFGWYDVDPNLPDAATSIIRIYNRAMRRWESLYMANRGNGALFFGGRREGDDVVLGFFETNLARGPITRFVFHDIQDDEYHWYAESSSDLGQSFRKTWIIDATRTELQ